MWKRCVFVCGIGWRKRMLIILFFSQRHRNDGDRQQKRLFDLAYTYTHYTYRIDVRTYV